MEVEKHLFQVEVMGLDDIGHRCWLKSGQYKTRLNVEKRRRGSAYYAV